MLLFNATATTSLWDTTQIKVVLPTILVTALVTALITEPLKVGVQNWWKRWQIRKHVLTELAYDFEKVRLIRTIGLSESAPVSNILSFAQEARQTVKAPRGEVR